MNLFADTVSKTEMEGIYAKDISFEQLDELQNIEATNPYALIYWLFENMIRDEQGNKFTEIQSEDDTKKLGVIKSRKITEAVMGAINDSGKH